MIEVLYFSDREVKTKLFSRVGAGTRLLVVTATRHASQMTPPPQRDPHRTLEQTVGHAVDQLLVVDEGTVEGMWRDPVGDLADALFPDNRPQAYAAATGYLLLRGHQVLAVVKKQGRAAADLWLLQQALHRVDPSLPAPHPPRRPGAAPKSEPPKKPGPPSPTRSPEEVLGIAANATPAEAKKQFHALIAQYHPDKVAHLAGEFRELAELRTRQILEAWEQFQRSRE